MRVTSAIRLQSRSGGAATSLVTSSPQRTGSLPISLYILYDKYRGVKRLLANRPEEPAVPAGTSRRDRPADPGDGPGGGCPRPDRGRAPWSDDGGGRTRRRRFPRHRVRPLP